MASGTNLPPYGALQKQFIDETRQSINADPRYFHRHDWREIKPPDPHSRLGKDVIVDQFYVKSISCWLPDMLPEPIGFMPSCPDCESAIGVSATKDWVRRPKILYGMSSHRYLDTKYYYCLPCKKSFLWLP
jgi:hypothetical protein